MRSVILGAMDAFSLFHFENALIYWKISLVGDTFSPEMIISC